jgi:hypothetical protein
MTSPSTTASTREKAADQLADFGFHPNVCCGVWRVTSGSDSSDWPRLSVCGPFTAVDGLAYVHSAQ